MRVLFIVNEAAGNGKGKKIWLRLQQQLTIDYQVAFTANQGHGQEIARQWAQRVKTKQLIVIVGGDGTIHEVVSGVVHNKLIVIGLVRAGSGNDFARYFPTFESAQQIENYLRSEVVGIEMDAGVIQLGTKQKEILVNNAGIGFDAFVTNQVNKSRIKHYLNKIGLGKLSYAVAVVRSLFSFERFDVTIRTNDRELHFKQAWFVAVSNQPYFGGGMKISPNSIPDDGKIELTIVYNISRIKLLFVFGTVFFEKHTKFKEIAFLQSDQFEIMVHRDHLDCHTDGDYVGKVGQVTNIHCTVEKAIWQYIKMDHHQK